MQGKLYPLFCLPENSFCFEAIASCPLGHMCEASVLPAVLQLTQLVRCSDASHMGNCLPKALAASFSVCMGTPKAG